MAAFSTPIFTVFNNGEVVPGAKVYTYVSGSTTPLTTYADANLTSPNPNPIIADANGQVTIYIPTTQAMKLDLFTATGAFIRTIPVIYPTANFTSGLGGEAVLPSAAITDLGSTGSNLVKVTGSTTITSLGESASTGNPIYYVRFAGTLTLTHNGTSLILPGSANITTSAGANAIFEYLGGGNWVCLFYQTATGAPLQAPAMTLLQTQVVSSPVASVDFTSFINSTYKEYVLEMFDVVGSSAADLMFRVSEDAGANWKSGAADYAWLQSGRSLAGSSIFDSNDSAAAIRTNMSALPSGSQSALAGQMRFYNPAGTSRYKLFDGSFAGTQQAFRLSGYYQGTVNAINALRVLASTGNIASGTLKLYGVN